MINHPILQPYVDIQNNSARCPFCKNEMIFETKVDSRAAYEQLSCDCKILLIHTYGIGGIALAVSYIHDDYHIVYHLNNDILKVNKMIDDLYEEMFSCPIPPIKMFDIDTLLPKIKIYTTFS